MFGVLYFGKLVVDGSKIGDFLLFGTQGLIQLTGKNIIQNEIKSDTAHYKGEDGGSDIDPVIFSKEFQLICILYPIP